MQHFSRRIQRMALCSPWQAGGSHITWTWSSQTGDWQTEVTHECTNINSYMEPGLKMTCHIFKNRMEILLHTILCVWPKM